MNHLGLFEGIGGFSLAARWAGWETLAWCEWDKNCQRVLKYHFPNFLSSHFLK
jgi:DNA (cytosine-5)-methyltransferase 1